MLYAKILKAFRKDPILGVLVFYDLAGILTLTYLVLNFSTIFDLFYTALAVIVFIGLTFFYYKNQKAYAQEIFTLLFAIIVAVSFGEPFLTQYVPFVLVFPLLVALVVTSSGWIIATGILVHFIMLYRAGFTGIYTDTISIILYYIAVLGTAVSKYIITSTASRLESSELEKESLANLVEGMGDGVAVIDTSWIVQVWNKSAEEITGYSQEEAIGQHVTQVLKLINQSTREENYRFIADLISSGKRTAIDSKILLVTKDGKDKNVGDSAAPLFDSKGNLSRIVIIFRDSSQEKAALALHSDFAYASHQLRTPLTQAIWTLDQAMNAPNSKVAKKALSITALALQSATKLADNLVAVSEVENNMLIPEPQMVAFAEVIKGALENIKKSHPSHRQRIEVKPISAIEGIETDSRILTNILTELLDNALTYSPPKQKISLEVTKKGNEYIIILSSHATSLPEEEKALMFTKFFRGSNKPDNSVGSGLGLYLAKVWAETLKGRIWFRVEDDVINFYVALPDKFTER